MSRSPSPHTERPNPTLPSTAPSYDPVGIFWDYGQPILTLLHIPKPNSHRELRALHECLRIQHRRQHPRPSKSVRGSEPLQGIPPAPRKIISEAIHPPVRTSVVWFVLDGSVRRTLPVKPRLPLTLDCPHNGKNSVDLMMIGESFSRSETGLQSSYLVQWTSWHSSRTTHLRQPSSSSLAIAISPIFCPRSGGGNTMSSSLPTPS